MKPNYQYLVTYEVVVDSDVKLEDREAEEKAEHIMEQTYIKPAVKEWKKD